MYVRLTAEGTRFELLDPDASLLRDALPRGGYEPAVCALLARAFEQPGATFFDVGALYGFFAVWAALRGVAVVAFEPGEQYAEVLELNLRRNGCEGARVERLALSDRDGELRFAARSAVAEPAADGDAGRSYVRGLRNHRRGAPGVGERVVAAPGYWRAPLAPWIAANLGERLGLFRAGEDQVARTVRQQPLDAWVREHGVAPTVVKIDVHGAEVAVVRGMRDALREHVRELVVEVHTSDLLVSGSHAELVAELEDAGLELFELRGFRRAEATLVPLVGEARRRFCDQREWTAEELWFMRCLYARRR